MNTYVRYGLLCMICSFLAVSSISIAQSPLSQQKTELVEEIYSNPQFAPLLDVQLAKQQLAELSKAVEQLSSTYDKLDSNRMSLEDKFLEVQVAIEYILGDMQRVEKTMKADITKISLSTKKIVSLRRELSSLKTDLSDSKEYLDKYIKFLYEIQNNFYGGNNVSTLKLVVKSDNVAQSISREDLVEILLDRLRLMIATIKQKQLEYIAYTRELNDERVVYQASIQNYQNSLETMEEQKQNLYQLLSYIQGDLEKATQKVEDLYTSKKELEDQVAALQQFTDPDTQKILDENSEVFSVLNDTDREDGQKYFTWPVFPIEHVAYTYQDRDHQEQYGYLLDGIRVEIPQGRSVRAPAPGIVYEVFNSPDIGLSWIVLIHKYGYITVLSPLSDISVAPGDTVKRGQIIGKSGGKPGTIGAGIDSDVPHLNIELLKNGASIDPFSVLDISIFVDDSWLPAEWETKYLQDLYSREVDIPRLLPLSGSTIEERRDDFLRQYAYGPYRDATIWYDGAEGTNINPLLGICIGFSETSFRNFKSENNIGNVGNDDSGNTVEFDTPVAGVYALYATLNNQYLGDYETLDQLSRYGNHNGYIYASSRFNWQKNVMTCLSSIYNLYVPEDFAFRLE